MYCLTTKACKEVDENKNDRLMFKMIGKIQPELELQETVAFVYPFFAKAGSSIPFETGI